ncbi:MAG: ABC transporter substrate-binding protein [Bacteroidales bacterium]|nr:ABC transporter substrate-binding protein [Bacteroidales bacterium]
MLWIFGNKKLLFRFSFFYLILLLVSCGNEKAIDNGKKIFRYNESAGIVSLDPAFAKDLPHIWACNQLYNGLVSLDEKLNIVPAIAHSWTVEDDGKTYIFNLRNDVYFHDNQVFNGVKRKVVASDFVFSFNRLIDPKIGSPGSWIFNYVRKDSDGYAFLALNDSVLRITLKEAFPSFLGILAMTYTSVLPKEAVQFYGNDFRKNPVGTGPFCFTYWKEGVKLVLQKNPEYFEFVNNERLPFIDGVSINFLIDRQTAFLDFIKGNLDFMSGIDARYKDELLTRSGLLRSKYHSKIYLESQAYLNTEFMGFFVDSIPGKVNPVQNLQLRKAINYAIDRNKMMKFLRNGIGKPGTGGMIPYGMPGHDSTGKYGYSYQPKQAIEIIRSNNFGSSITITTSAEYVDLAKFIQSQLTNVGLQVKIEVSPPATIRQARALGKLEFFRSSWVADYPDAENYLAMFYSRNFAPYGPNYTHYKSEAFDALYEKASGIPDLTDRIGLYRQMDSLIMSDAPVVVLFYDEVLRFVNNRVTGFESNPVNILDLRRVKIH